MNGNTFRMPARRLAAGVSATVLAAGPAVLAGAQPAYATGGEGRASAVVLRTGLDVSLVNRTVNVPLTVTLNEVQAPENAERTTLTARLDGVNRGKPFTVVRAAVASAKATATAETAEGRSELARARVHVPGLPLLSLIEVEAVSARATCAAGEAPVAEAKLPGSVTVFGKKVTVSAGGTSAVKVPGVGEVTIDFARKETTSRTAAATALELKVAVDPLKLNVAEVEGTVTLAGATCESPAAPEEAEAPAGAEAEPKAGAEAEPAAQAAEEPEEKSGVKTQGGEATEQNLAETGGSSATPYIAAGSAVLLAAGGGAVALTRRRRG